MEVLKEINLNIRIHKEFRCFIRASRTIQIINRIVDYRIFFEGFGSSIFPIVIRIGSRCTFLHLQTIQIINIISFLIYMITPCIQPHSQETGNLWLQITAHIIFLHSWIHHQTGIIHIRSIQAIPGSLFRTGKRNRMFLHQFRIIHLIVPVRIRIGHIIRVARFGYSIRIAGRCTPRINGSLAKHLCLPCIVRSLIDKFHVVGIVWNHTDQISRCIIGEFSWIGHVDFPVRTFLGSQ